MRIRCLNNIRVNQWRNFQRPRNNFRTVVADLTVFQDSTGVPIMNIVWFVPALVGFAMVLLTVKRSYPPSPPSRSAQLNCKNSPDFSYLKTIWVLIRNLPCMILTLTIGMSAYLKTLNPHCDKDPIQ